MVFLSQPENGNRIHANSKDQRSAKPVATLTDPVATIRGDRGQRQGRTHLEGREGCGAGGGVVLRLDARHCLATWEVRQASGGSQSCGMSQLGWLTLPLRVLRERRYREGVVTPRPLVPLNQKGGSPERGPKRTQGDPRGYPRPPSDSKVAGRVATPPPYLRSKETLRESNPETAELVHPAAFFRCRSLPSSPPPHNLLL